MLDELRTSGPRPGELDRVLAQTETDFVSSMQSAGDRAEQLSRFATYYRRPALLNEQVRAIPRRDRRRTFARPQLNASVLTIAPAWSTSRETGRPRHERGRGAPGAGPAPVRTASPRSSASRCLTGSS